MTSIPLALVVAFLRPRGAFHVLEGAPYTSADVCGFAGLTVDAIDDEVEQRPDAALYLGSSDVCPAAEGWASRVLAMAINRQAHLRMAGDQHLSIGPTWVLLGTASHGHGWAWTGVVPSGWAGAVQTMMTGEAPFTPAERLAAVLTYELERVR